MLDYLKLDGPVFAELLDKAREFVNLNERSMYTPYREAIDAIIAATPKMYFVSKTGSGDLCEYWTEANPFFIAKTICETIYREVDSPFIDKRLIEARTNVRGRSITIVVNGQRLYNLTRLVLPYPPAPILRVLVNGAAASPLAVAIAKSHALYLPKNAEQWPVLAESLPALFAAAMEQCSTFRGGADGGSDDWDDVSPCEFDMGGGSGLPAGYAGGGGRGGATILTRPDMPKLHIAVFAGRPTFMVSDTPTPPKGGRVMEHDLFIQSDFRLQKWTVYSAQGPALYDAYNSPKFDLVPLARPGQVTALVQLRFNLITLLMDGIIAARGGKSHAAQLVASARGYMAQAQCPTPGLEFAGTNIDEGLDFMRLVKAERVEPFIPALAEKRGGGMDDLIDAGW